MLRKKSASIANFKKLYDRNLKEKLTVRFSPEDLTQLRRIASQSGLGITTLIRFKMLEYLEKDRKQRDN